MGFVFLYLYSPRLSRQEVPTATKKEEVRSSLGLKMRDLRIWEGDLCKVIQQLCG